MTGWSRFWKYTVQNHAFWLQPFGNKCRTRQVEGDLFGCWQSWKPQEILFGEKTLPAKPLKAIDHGCIPYIPTTSTDSILQVLLAVPTPQLKAKLLRLLVAVPRLSDRPGDFSFFPHRCRSDLSRTKAFSQSLILYSSDF